MREVYPSRIQKLLKLLVVVVVVVVVVVLVVVVLAQKKGYLMIRRKVLAGRALERGKKGQRIVMVGILME